MSKMSEFTNKFCNPTFFQCLTLVIATLNIFCNGLHVGWPTPSLPQLLNRTSTTIPVTDDEGSWIATILLIGGVLGSILSAVILDRFGRKPVILFTSVPFLASWIMIAFAESAMTILIARFIAGISDGLIFCSVPVYLSEIAYPRIRGFIGTSVQVVSVSGVFIVNIIGSYLSIKVTAIICATFPILLFCTFIWIPESPYYLILKGRVKEARKSLCYFRHKEEIDEELSRLIKSVETEKQYSGTCLDLFNVRSNRKALLIMIILRTAQQFSGATAIMVYCQIIFKEIGFQVSSIMVSIIYLGIQVVMSIACSLFVDKIGRKPLLIVSLSGIILTLLIEECYFGIKERTNINTNDFSLIPVVSLIAFVIMYGIGLFSIPLLVVSELFPINVRAIAVSFSDIYFCVISTVAIKVFQVTKDNYGLFVPFFIFIVSEIVSLIFVTICVPETKGKTLEEVQDILKRESNEIVPTRNVKDKK